MGISLFKKKRRKKERKKERKKKKKKERMQSVVDILFFLLLLVLVLFVALYHIFLMTRFHMGLSGQTRQQTISDFDGIGKCDVL